MKKMWLTETTFKYNDQVRYKYERRVAVKKISLFLDLSSMRSAAIMSFLILGRNLEIFFGGEAAI